MADGERRLARDIVVIGGSSGSLAPIRALLAELPADFAASICCVQHLASNARSAVEVLQKANAMRVVAGVDDTPMERGVAYFAPADRHLVLDGRVMRVLRGPRENNVRPSIDVLFRSAAVSYRSRVIAVLLSGTQWDGVLGLSAVKRCGGVTIVQEPSDALSPELPMRALRDGEADHICAAKDLAALLLKLTAVEPPEAPDVPQDLQMEAHAAAAAMADPSVLDLNIGQPLHVTCPECDGPVWRLNSPGPPDFRCEVGHGFSAESLLAGQSRALEHALWVAFRTLKERGILIDDMAKTARARGFESSAASFDLRRNEVEQHAAAIHDVLTAGWPETLEEPMDPTNPKREPPNTAGPLTSELAEPLDED